MRAASHCFQTLPGAGCLAEKSPFTIRDLLTTQRRINVQKDSPMALCTKATRQFFSGSTTKTFCRC
jgi:hypothetical protein